MTKTTSKFRNIPGYQSLCRELFSNAETSFSDEELDELLDFLGVKDSIQNLLQVVGNFSRICRRILPAYKHPKWFLAADRLAQLGDRAKEILDQRQRLSRIPGLTHPIDKTNVQAYRGLVGPAPFYATLGYFPDDVSLLNAYDILWGQILVAHLTLIEKGQSETYAAALEGALATLRSFAHSTRLLVILPDISLAPEDYVRQLRALPPSKKLAPLCALLGSAVDLVAAASLAELKGNDPEKISDYVKTVRLLAGDVPSTPIPDLEIADELDTPTDDLAPGTDGSLGVFQLRAAKIPLDTLKFQAQQIVRSRAMQNQLLPFAWTELNSWDLQRLVGYVFSEESADSGDTLLSKIMLGLMLFYGLSTERLAGLRLVGEAVGDFAGDAYLLLEKRLRLHSPGPQYKTPLSPAAEEQAVSRLDHIDLTVPAPLVLQLERLLERSRPEDDSLFGLEAVPIGRLCARALSPLRQGRQDRLILGRMQRYMERLLGSLPGSDLAAASLALGKELYLARTRIHYAAFDRETLRRQHQQACRLLCRQAGYDLDGVEGYPEETSCHVGTPVRPRLEALREMVTRLRESLKGCSGRFTSTSELARYHNDYSLYTALMVAYSTGYRAVSTPYVRAGLRDEASGFAIIRDKDSADYYHSRLAWLPPACLRQLRLYEHHVEYLRPRILSLDSSLPFFFLSPDGQVLPVGPSQMEEQLGRFGFYLPPNVQRHFIKSELQENGCRIEAIELLLGHWHLGQEGWFDTSALSPLAFREELERHLPPLLLRLGLTPLPGLQKPPSARCAPTISPAERKGPFISPGTQERLRRPWRRRISIHPPGQIWQELVKREPCDRPLSEMFDEQQQIVLSKLQRLQPYLYRGAADLQIPDEALRNLLRQIRSKGLSPRQYAMRLDFVFDGLERGAERLNWRVNLPSRPFFVSKGTNRMCPSVMGKMRGYRKVEQAFLADLAASGTVSAELELARILVSAILYGGLNHRCWAQALLPGLARRVYQWQEILWVDLWAQPPEESPQAQWLQQRNATLYRRWLADPTTQLLIYRWLRHPDPQREAADGFDLETIYDGYRRHLQAATGVALPRIDTLLRWGNAWATLHLPPFLSAYAADSIASACLPDPAWLRVLTGNHYPTAGRPGGGVRKKTDSSVSVAEQIERLREVCREVREQGASMSRDKIIEWLRSYVREHGEHLCHTNHLLVAWMIQLLSPRAAESERRQKEPEKASTAASYPLTFARALLHVAVKLDLTSLDEDEFRNVFGAVVDSIAVLRQGNAEGMGNLKDRRADYIVERLNQFLGFLQVFHGSPGVLIVREGQKSSLRGTAEVRANLMTATEFGRLKRMLQGGPSPPGRTQRMTLVAAILAFWGGLRAAEIQGLQIGDVQGDDHPELLVQRNGFREVKSEASTRRIPLLALLPKEDLETVRQWHAFRSMELGASASAPLFCDSPGDVLPCSRETLLGPLAQACKQVTGDQGTVIHTLRHSFATWTLTSLLSGNTGSLGSLPAFWKEESFGPGVCERRKSLLLENETLGRKALYATAALLGHSDTTTAMASYVHFCDWLLWQHLRHPGCAPPLTAKALSQIAGCSVPNGYKLLQSGEHPLLGSAAKMARGYAERLKHPLEAQGKCPLQSKKAVKTKKPFPQFDQALNGLQKAGLPKKKAMPPEHLTALQYLYEKISSIGLAKKASTSAKLLLAAYRAHDQAFQFSKPEDGSKAVELLRDLGIDFRCRYYPSRWRKGEDLRSIAVWSQSLKTQIGRGEKHSGRNNRYGLIRIYMVDLPISGRIYQIDKEMLYVLVTLLAILSHLQSR